jgi:predicted Zn-dependent peptidase
VREAYSTKEMDVRMPNTIIGYKLPPNHQSSHSIMKQELIYSMLLDLVLGKSTDAYEQLLEQQLINDSFGMDITVEDDYSFVLLGGQTLKPKELQAAIHQCFIDGVENGLDQDHFIRTKKQIIGGFIQALNSLEYIANQFTKYHFMGGNLFVVLDIAKSITLEDLETALIELLKENVQTSYTITPQKKA